METGSGADTGSCGGVTVGNAASGGGGVAGNAVSGISDAVAVDAGNTTNGGVGAGKASFVTLPSGLRFLVLRSTLS